jgi:RNA polymerase sigma factor (sigma-70 family)
MDDTPNTRPSLLVRIRDPQDEQAWREFLDIYEPLVYRLARRKGFQDADARELSQEVFLAVASAIDRWDPDPSRGSFRGWLFRIARNLMINLLAKQQRHPQGTGSSDVKHLLEGQPAPVGEDSALFDREYRREAFRWAAEQIRGEFRETTWKAFWLTSVEGEEIKEVAQMLGITVGAVYIARSRVMARLRQTIERLEGTSQTG